MTVVQEAICENRVACRTVNRLSLETKSNQFYQFSFLAERRPPAWCHKGPLCPFLFFLTSSFQIKIITLMTFGMVVNDFSH